MSKSGISGRTINLAKQGTSLRERKVKLLLLEKEKDCNNRKPHASLPVGLTATPPSAKKIRVCSPSELKRSCAPVITKCPSKPSLTLGRVIASSLSLISRCALAGGLVFWTWHLGLWGSADETEQLMIGARNAYYGTQCVRTAAGESDECSAPRMDTKSYQTRESWNKAVVCALKCVSSAFITLTSIGQSGGNAESNKCEDEVDSKKTGKVENVGKTDKADKTKLVDGKCCKGC